MDSLNNLLTPDPLDDNCRGALTFTSTVVIVIVSCVLGIVWAIFNFIQVRKINV